MPASTPRISAKAWPRSWRNASRCLKADSRYGCYDRRPKSKQERQTIRTKGGVMKRSNRIGMRIFAALGLALACATAHAQAWPHKPIIFLNPFPAGGGTDTFARPIAARLSQTLGAQVLIENQGGAGGTVGAANAAKRAPDGYNWFFGAVHHTIAESLYTRLPYSLVKDFEPVTVAAFVPNVVVIHPKHADKFKTLKDLIEYLKKNPGALNYG